MTSLKQNIRTVLSEVETFLVETLKSVKLNKNVAEQKEQLVEKVKRILEEIPGSATGTLNDSRNESNGSLKISGGGDGSSSGNSNSGAPISEEEPGYGENITKVAANTLKNVLQSGLLDKKKKSGFKTWESQYCVVSGNCLYLYKKQTDSKQKEAFCLTGYEFQENSNLDSSRKDMCFELTKPGCITYQFRAGSKEGMHEWRDAITKGIQFTVPSPTENEEEPGEMYEDVGEEEKGEAAASTPQAQTMEFEDPDDIYEECGEDLLLPPPPLLIAEEETEPPDDVYDACMSAPGQLEDSSLPPPPPPEMREQDPSPSPALPQGPPPPRPPKSELPPLPKTMPPPPVPDRRPSNSQSSDESQPPPLPTNPPPLPSRGMAGARVPHLRNPFMDREEDFENIFYGRWDCTADSNKELAFKRGDLIHVLSRDFDTEEWWVGELKGKIGLVPKQYLCPAYEMVR